MYIKYKDKIMKYIYIYIYIYINKKISMQI